MKLVVNRQNLFDLERLRDVLALKRRFVTFKKTYLFKSNNIQDRNTGTFWNRKIRDERDLLQNSPIYNHKIDTIVGIISRYKGNILDIGFGYGDIEKKLKYSKYRFLYGIDISNVAVENLSKMVSGNFRKGNIYNLPYKNDYFDVVLALDILEHLPPKMVFTAYKEIARVLKKGGIVVISVPLNENLEEMLKRGQNPNSHLRAYTPNIIKFELEISKFNVVKESYFFAFSKFYYLKSILVRLIPFKIREPNLIVLEAVKR